MPDPRARIILDTLLPSQTHPTLPYGLFDTGFDAFYADFEATANPGLRRSFQLAVFMATWIAPVLIRRVPPISQHPRDIREQALRAMETSRIYFIRQMMLILKIVAGLCYGANREVRDAIGYPVQHDDPRTTLGQRSLP